MGRTAAAFTLTELLVVIGIVVLFVTLALPAFSLISGGKSIQAGENLISAFLGRARVEAIGLQDYRGVGIYVDPVTGRSTAAIVSFPTISDFNAGTTYPRFAYVEFTISGVPRYFVSNIDNNVGNTPTPGVALTRNLSPPWWECGPSPMDIVTDSDIQPFPAGVGVQLINDCAYSGTGPGATRKGDGYVATGVILFDGNGQLAKKRVSFAQAGRLGTSGNFTANKPYYAAPAAVNGPQTGYPLFSQFGLVLFDRQTYDGLPGTAPPDPILFSQDSVPPPPYDTSVFKPSEYNANSDELNREVWLDKNSTPLLINRYNGTLVKGE